MTVLVEERHPGARLVLLDRPDRRNALDMPTVERLGSQLLEGDPKVVVLGSTDARAFSAGVDRTISAHERRILSDRLYALYQAMQEASTIVIAAADGHCVGAGAQLLLASDIRIAGPRTAIRFAGAGHGLAVGAWGLPALVGRGRALELCLTMRTVGREEALELGLIDFSVDEPFAAAIDLADTVLERDAGAVARCKQVIGSAADPRRALALERETNRASWNGYLPPKDVS